MFTPGFWRIKRLADAVPEILHLQREMNRLFSDVGRSVPQDYPMINMWEKDDSVIVMAEAPGMDVEKLILRFPAIY
jgi:HSP20 family molecular chaperone IbpA